ncbi:MAG: methyltransferase, partial [Spirochaetae bacterium HGW-Spirochaetae-9]
MTELQPLVNKTVEFAYRGARLSFDLSHALFSSYAIDTGTRFLLKEIAHDEALARARSILDAGCGAGIIG